MKRAFLLWGFTVVLLFFFASNVFAADGFGAGTTGGAGGDTVTVDSNAEDLKSYAESDSAYIIQVSGTIDLISIGGKLRIKSNKTIKGIGPDPTIIGNIAFKSGASNVIIEGLNITNPDDYGEGDGITVKYATDIFITKCTVYECADGCIDITRESDYITVSWCKFYYVSQPSHRYVNLIGGDDSHTGDAGKLHITFHHNWWYSLCDQRMPRVRFGQVHVYNNYYSCSGNSYCIGVGDNSQIRVEDNYFDSVNQLWEQYYDAGNPGSIGWNSSNVYAGSSTEPTWADNDYPVFPVPYTYTLDDGVDIKSIVMAGAGAGIPQRVINPADGACGVSTDVVLSWAAEPNANFYDIYFGTDFDDVGDANTDSAEYMGRYDFNSYYVGGLEEDTTYYWRIDDVNLSDPCSPYKGDVWSFTTVRVYYVDTQAGGNKDGSSWEDAFNYLQNALRVAGQCDEIRVAEGIYKPDEDYVYPLGSGEREATFQLKNGLAIKGGYAGYGEPDPNERDPNTYETILSGDLEGDDVDVNDPCDLPNEPTRAENSYHVVTSIGTDETAVLDGFIITAGNANGGDIDIYGGGMLNLQGNSTLTNCAFIGNSADYGGGMFSYNSSPPLTNCTFIGNSAVYGGGVFDYSGSPPLTNCTFIGNLAVYGGGMFNYYSSSPTLTNCTFSGNSAEDQGGGMWNWEQSNPTLTNCMFSDNSAEWAGGGMSNGESSPMLTDCMFTGNSAGEGGGMYNGESNPTLTNCMFTGNSARIWGGGMLDYSGRPPLTNCTFIGNSAVYGGGMFNYYNSSPTLTNCTFSNNSADDTGGGMCNMQQSGPMITNCILWGNTALIEPQIYSDGTGSTTVTYSDVQGGWSGTGNKNDDPLFVDASNDDLHLLPGSPCIDAGDPGYVAGPDETDLDGLPRIIGGRIDMGAYEYHNKPPVAVTGPNQIAYAWVNGYADVNLDGSGSYDDDNDGLDYYWSWTIDGNTCEANGVSPTISLPVGEHTIELVVDDGIEESEPNYCTIEVIAPLRARLFCIPYTLYPKTYYYRGRLLALISMPPGIRKVDIDLTEPLVFYPGQVESQHQFAFEFGRHCYRRTYVWAWFDKSACAEYLEPGFNRVDVVGKLTSGRYYDAAGYLRLVSWKWHH